MSKLFVFSFFFFRWQLSESDVTLS